MPILIVGLALGLSALPAQSVSVSVAPRPLPLVNLPPAPMPIDPASWVRSKDYPKAALRAEETGTTGFRLDVSRKGKATACTVTFSSGSAVLDAATCSVLLRRARFSPARDANGRGVAGTYASRFRWMLPK